MSTTATGNTTAKPMTAQFQWDDPLLFSEMLRDDEKLVLHSARSFCSDRLMPRVLEAHRHEKFDRAILTELGELGFLGATLPEEYGCSGVNSVCYGLIAREVERVELRFPFSHERAVEPRDVPYFCVWK